MPAPDRARRRRSRRSTPQTKQTPSIPSTNERYTAVIAHQLPRSVCLVASSNYVGNEHAAARVLVARADYALLGKRGDARRALASGLLGTVALLGIACILPEKFPKMPLPQAYTFAIRELAKKLQGADLNAHFAAGGARQSNWRALGVGVAGLGLVLAAFVVVVVVLLFPGSLGG
jgi:hypothetical protein